jgi:hypothetical protein
VIAAGEVPDAQNEFIIRCENRRIARGWTMPVDQYADEFWE